MVVMDNLQSVYTGGGESDHTLILCRWCAHKQRYCWINGHFFYCHLAIERIETFQAVHAVLLYGSMLLVELSISLLKRPR